MSKVVYEYPNRAVTTVRMDVRSAKDWEQWFLLSSDRHHDNAHTDHGLELKHLEMARERGAGIIDAGDLFCAMQGKWDKRADKTALRDEYQNGDYLDALVNHAVDFYAPYADLFVVVGRGNHEQSIRKKHETDLTERFCQGLTTKTGHHVHAGGYGGWVNFCIKRHGEHKRFRLKFFHGSGGGGMMSHGTLATRRMASWLPDADIIMTGHTHDTWQVTLARERLTESCEVVQDEQVHVKTGTYKEEYGDGYEGWHVERGAPPKPLGAWWLKFYCYKRNGKGTSEWRFDLIRAD